MRNRFMIYKTGLTIATLLVSALLISCSSEIANSEGGVTSVRDSMKIEDFEAYCVYPRQYPNLGIVRLYDVSKYFDMTYAYFGDNNYHCDATTFSSKDFLRDIQPVFSKMLIPNESK